MNTIAHISFKLMISEKTSSLKLHILLAIHVYGCRRKFVHKREWSDELMKIDENNNKNNDDDDDDDDDNGGEWKCR